MVALTYHMMFDERHYLVSHWCSASADNPPPPNVLQVAESFVKAVEECLSTAPIKFNIVRQPVRVLPKVQCAAAVKFILENRRLSFEFSRTDFTGPISRQLMSNLEEIVGRTAEYLKNRPDPTSLEPSVTQGLV